jgi:hypothetical protein
MNRKSQFFSILLVVMFTAVLITAIILVAKASQDKSLYVGQKQAALLSMYAKADSTLYWYDTAFQIAGHNGIDWFESHGHFTGLGTYAYSYWDNGTDRYTPNEKTINKKLTYSVAMFFPQYAYVFYLDQSDFYVDVNQKEIGARKMWPLYSYNLTTPNSTYDIEYRLSERFTDFNYTLINDFIDDVNLQCSAYEDYGDFGNETEFQDCIEDSLSPFQKIKLMKDCESGEDFKLKLFAEEYSDCANSYDYDCLCRFTDSSGIVVTKDDRGTFAKLGKLEAELPAKHTGTVDSVMTRTQSGLQPADTSLPMCRLIKRSADFCMDRGASYLIVDKFVDIKTKFAVNVADEREPPEITPAIKGNSVSWEPSIASDVIQYRLYIVQKGNPFYIDEYIPINREKYAEQFKNIDQKFTYTAPVDLSKFDVQIIAEDSSGNFAPP